MQFNLIGAGHLARHLAASLTTCASLPLGAVYNRSYERAKALVLELQQGQPVPRMCDLPPAEITIIAVSDDAIAQVAMELSLHGKIRPNDIVFHCSGAKDHTILLPLRALGATLGSFHPPKPFSPGPLRSDALQDLYCVLEGDEPFKVCLAGILRQCGAKTVSLLGVDKPLYHAAAVFASNYPLLLLHHAQSLLIQAGIEPDVAKEMVLKSVGDMVRNYERALTAPLALTGPIKRGDLSTLGQHLDVLQGEIKQDYQRLGLSLAKLIGSDEAIIAQLSQGLDDALKH